MVLVSISHALADGYTFYKIFKMLDLNQKIEPMVYVRNLNFYDDVIKTVGKKDFDYMKSFSFISNVIGNFIWKRKFIVRCVEINEDAIKEEKLKYLEKEKGMYVTTNDIINSRTMN